MLERDLERKCREVAHDYGLLFLKWVSPGSAGVPDRILIAPGRIVFVELKTPSNDLTPLQRYWRRQIEARGHRYVVVRSKEQFQQIAAEVSGSRG